MADTEPILDLGELLALYKQDASQTVRRLMECIQNWREISTGGAARAELRKLSHQLRGSGRTYGFKAVTRVSKAMEKIVERMEQGRVQADDRTRQSLSRKISALERAFQV